MMKLGKALLAALALVGTTTASFAYVGDWAYDDNRGGSEYVYLNDYDSGLNVEFYGVEGWCGRRGASYATMRSTLSSNGNSAAGWWVDYDCGSTQRICVEGGNGNTACSTYGVYEWWYE